MKLLASENFPRVVVDALVAAGHDVVWVRTACPGVADPDVLSLAVSEDRALVTFDQDFGHLAFHAGLRRVRVVWAEVVVAAFANRSGKHDDGMAGWPRTAVRRD